MAEKIAKFSLKEINLVLKRLSKKQFGVNYFLGAFFSRGMVVPFPKIVLDLKRTYEKLYCELFSSVG